MFEEYIYTKIDNNNLTNYQIQYLHYQVPQIPFFIIDFLYKMKHIFIFYYIHDRIIILPYVSKKWISYRYDESLISILKNNSNPIDICKISNPIDIYKLCNPWWLKIQRYSKKYKLYNDMTLYNSLNNPSWWVNYIIDFMNWDNFWLLYINEYEKQKSLI